MASAGSVLLIDRDSELTSILSSYLTTMGYRVVFTNRVREALKKLGNQRFDHIFIDPELAPDNTNELFEELMTSGRPNSKSPIVVTSFNMDYTLTMPVAKRIKGILPKPFTLPEFALQLVVKGS